MVGEKVEILGIELMMEDYILRGEKSLLLE
jgi:hypothetical protein